MNRSLLMGTLLGAAVVTAGGAVAGFHALEASRSADVIAARETFKTVRTPRQDCHEEEVTRVRPPKDSHRLAGTGIGAVVGGLLGNQVGGGNGKVLATVAGAAAGGYAGNQIQQKVQQGNTYTAKEQRCATVYDSHPVSTGYEVEYVLNGVKHQVRMDHDPGKSLPVKDGKVVIGAR